MSRPQISVVSPCHNEESTVAELADRVSRTMGELAVTDWELVLVDDGSTDGTLVALRDLARTRSEVRYISLSRNFGKEAAIYAGLKASLGEQVVLIDADLQHPPEVIVDMLRAQKETGADQVIARRDREGESQARKRASAAYYRLARRFMEVPITDGEGDFRLMSRRVVDTLVAMGERSRFSKGLFAWVGYPRTAIEYTNVTRTSGGSSWSMSSLMDYGIDGVLSFNTKPLRTMIHIGWFGVAAFLAYLAWLVVNAMVFGIATPGYITIIASVVFLAGIQLLCLGVIGEYVGRIFLEVKQRPIYLVQESGGREADPLP